MPAPTFEEKVIDAFQLAGAALVKYEKMAEEKKAEDEKVAAAIPTVVEALLRFNRIDATDKEACARALANPVEVLNLMKKLAAHRNATEIASLGEQVDGQGNAANGQSKEASVEKRGGYVGRVTSEKPESWRRFEAGLGMH
jgi:hypothetical protein